MSNSSGFLPNNDLFSSKGIPGLDGAFHSSSMNSPSSELGSVPWNNADRLTISFAPDGTRISKYTSDLYEAFGDLLSANQLEAQILKAFQSWARLSNVNVGAVSDSGMPFGSNGLVQGDLRFGDIRIGAIPMAESVYAVTVRNDPLIAGTWAGDILFNSNATFNSVNDFFAVALHEAGHALGLEHSASRSSVMNPGQLNSVITGLDTQALRELYGFRRMDPADLEGHSNNTAHDATRIKNPGSLNGEVPLIAFGDINVNTDVDYFELQSLSGYTGKVKFEFVSEGISLLRAKISIFDENLTLLQSVIGSGIRGSRLSVTLPNVVEGENYLVKVEAADQSLYSTGSFAIKATMEDNLTVPESKIDPVLRGNYWRLDQNDIHQIFVTPNDYYFNIDLAINDTFAAAQALRANIMFSKQTHYQIQASFSYLNDLDFYTIKAPSDLVPGNVLTVTLDTLEEDRLVPTVQVFNASQQPLVARTLINGNGQLVLQVDGVSAGATYFVKALAENSGDRFDLGNYNLVARFDRTAATLQNLGAGTLTKTSTESYHSLYVAEPQMLHFALSAESTATRSQAQVWVTVYSKSGQVVYRDLTLPGQTRTAKSVVLRPGYYSILVSLAVDASVGAGTPISVDYNLDGVGVTDPIGPEILSAAQKPFKKAGPNDPNYVYPNNTLSPNTFIVVEGQNVSLPNGSAIPPIYVDANAWYWYNGWLVKEVPPM